MLVDDHEMVIEGLKAMLTAFSDRVRVVGQAVGAERALEVIKELNPDIVLCDVRMQGSSGLDLCQALRERDADRKVVMLSVYDDEQYLFQAMRVGASGYLLKSISSDELVRQLEFVHRGETAIDPGMAAQGLQIYRANGCAACHTEQVQQTGVACDVFAAIIRTWSRADHDSARPGYAVAGGSFTSPARSYRCANPGRNPLQRYVL